MILYGMWDGGMMYCCALTKAGKRCRNKGYTTDKSRGYWCQHHKDQELK